MPSSFSGLAKLAAKQHGLMTHAQAISAGLTRTKLSRLVKAKVWQQVRPRVFRRTAADQTEEQELVAICLWLGEGTVVSHRSAARILGLNLKRGLPEVTTARHMARNAEDFICHRTDDLTGDDLKAQSKIPITNGARTIIDLASCLSEEALAIAVEEAWRLRVAAPSWVQKRLGEIEARGRQVGALVQILEDCATRKKPLESALEVRAWRLIKKAGLPTPRAGYEFSDEHGQPGRIDIAYPAQQLAIECDGYEHHGTREAFESDRLRTTRLAALGWRVFQITSKQLDEQPAAVVQRIKEALTYRTASWDRPQPVADFFTKHEF